MMDLSDGLGADLPRLAKASGVGFAIEIENLPLAVARRSITQFQKAKITNCSSPFHDVTETAWSENGEASSRSYL